MDRMELDTPSGNNIYALEEVEIGYCREILSATIRLGRK